MARCVGRERELAWITSRLEATSANATGLVIVSGGPGIGKSRLITELREQSRIAGFPVLEGWCVPHSAFAPFVSIGLQALAYLRSRGEQEQLAPGDLDALAPLVSIRAHKTPEHDEGEGAIRFVEAVGRLLAAVGRVRPVLVLLRGFSRADEASRALVRSILDAAGPVGEPTPGAAAALLVVSTIPESLGDWSEHPRASVLALDGLDVEGVRKLVADDGFVTRLFNATRGNPESILSLLERPVPSRQSEFTQHLAQLGDNARRMLASLGASGRPLPVEVLAHASGIDAETAQRAVPSLVDAKLVWRDLDSAAGAVVVGLVRTEDGITALNERSTSERPLLHQRLGEALERWNRVPLEEVYEQLLRGHSPAEVAPRIVDAAQSLLRRHAPSAALSLLVRASNYATREVFAQFAPLAAAAAKLTGSHSDARTLVHRALECNLDHADLARIEAELCLSMGDLDACQAALDHATGCVREEQTDVRAAIAATRAELSYQRGSLEEAEEQALIAIELSPEDNPLHTQARNALTKVYLWRGDLDRSWDWNQENIARARARGATTEVLRGIINLGVISIRRGDFTEAERQFESARAMASRGGTMMLRGVLKENEAVIAHLRGRYGEALTLYQEALGILIRVGNRQFLARIANNLGELYVNLGETSRARRLCDNAAQVGRGLSRGVTAEGLLLRGQVELLDARPDAARAALSEALSMFVASGEKAREFEAHLLLARAALVDGDLPRVNQELSQIPDLDDTIGLRLIAERQRLVAEAQRAEGHDALAESRKALELAEQADDPDLRLRAHVLLGVVLIDRGDEIAAKRHTDAAEAIRRDLVAKVPENLRSSYESALGRTGLTTLLTRIAETTGSPLSPRKIPINSSTALSPDRGGLIGESSPMQALRRTIARVSPADTTVLLRGESGTGKERVAEAIHRASRRRNGPLVKVNCAALAEGLLLSELFGHEKGAFTGAAGRRKGRFEAADTGTIFLDEIGDISPAMQSALLRVLQERTFERVGGTTPIHVDVRVIAATNRDLEAAMKNGTFREDLYYRLADITIRLPPLRDRLEDIPLLAMYLVDQMAREHGIEQKRLSPAAMRRLLDYLWPGNVRELGSVLRSALVLSESDEIQPEDLPLPNTQRAAESKPPSTPVIPTDKSEVEVVYDRIRGSGISLFDMRRELEKGCIARALEESHGNITRAAALLGMKRPRLSQLVREYGLVKGALDGLETSE